MYDHRQTLSDEVVAALFQKYLPVETIPSHVEKQLWRQVLGAVKELKSMGRGTPPHSADRAISTPYQNSPLPALIKKWYAVHHGSSNQDAPRRSRQPAVR
jgi:hypothetical protein